MQNHRDRNHLIASAASTLGMLEVFAEQPGPLPLNAFVAATGKPKGTVHRMLSTLVNTGFVIQDEATGHYRLTLKLLRIGSAVANELDPVKVARPWLERLVRATDETVHLAVLNPSGDVVYVAKVESPRSIRVQTQLGQSNPSWCTATGRSLLAFNPEVADMVLGKRLDTRTSRTVTDPRRLRSALAEVASQGYAVTLAENHPEMGGIAAPIRDYTGQVVAACGVAVPVFRMDQKLVERCIPPVVQTAASISEDLGYPSKTKRKKRYATQEL